MKATDFTNLIKKRFAKAQVVLGSKAVDYASTEDRLKNFYDGASFLETTPEKYALSLVTKHFVALKDKINKEEPMTPEFIDEKIGDIINYMLLIEALNADE